MFLHLNAESASAVYLATYVPQNCQRFVAKMVLGGQTLVNIHQMVIRYTTLRLFSLPLNNRRYRLAQLFVMKVVEDFSLPMKVSTDEKLNTQKFFARKKEDVWSYCVRLHAVCRMFKDNIFLNGKTCKEVL